jgi:hypothetical protein
MVTKMKKRKMELLALVLPIFLLFFVQGVFSLQEVAGPLVISVPIGGSNSAQWGLLNDGNQSITVSLNATGDAAKYLSFPKNVYLQPGKIVYISITAAIPNTSSGGNITGTLYALQDGQSGQVQINIQMMKNVTIMVTGQSTTSTTTTTPSGVGGGVVIYTSTTTTSTIPVSPKTTSTPTTTVQTTTTTVPTTTTTTVPATNPITGFATFVSSTSGISVLFSLVGITAFTAVFYKKWYVKRKMEKVVSA